MCPVDDDSNASELLEGATTEQEREARLALLAELREAGVPEEELRRAVAENRLVLLPVERALSYGDERLTAEEVAERSGLDVEFLDRVNRALGRPRPAPGERAFDEADVQAAKNISLIRQAGIPDESIFEVTRVLGQGMANLAATLATAFGSAFLRAGDTEYELSARYGEETAQLLPLLEPGLGHALAHAPAHRAAPGGGRRRRARERPPAGSRGFHGRVRRPHRLHAPGRERAGGRARRTGGALRGAGRRNWWSRRCGWSRRSATRRCSCRSDTDALLCHAPRPGRRRRRRGQRPAGHPRRRGPRPCPQPRWRRVRLGREPGQPHRRVRPRRGAWWPRRT